MDILIYLDSEFYGGFDGHIFNYVRHRTFGLSRVGFWSHFEKFEFYIQYICQSMRNDLKSTNLKSELKNLNAILRKIVFCVSKIDILGRIYENAFLTPKRQKEVPNRANFQYAVHKKCVTAIGEEKTK